MFEDNEVLVIKSPQVDFSFQLNLSRDKTEKKIFAYLSEIAQKLSKTEKRLGALVVLGSFGYKNQAADGMRSLTKDKVDLYLNINFAQFKDEIMKILESGDDGAIIINQDGQILAEKVYLTVDNPSVDIPDGTGTRHISACSFSTRPDVLATFTLSEETLTVRIWKDGAYTDQYNPNHKGEE